MIDALYVLLFLVVAFIMARVAMWVVMDRLTGMMVANKAFLAYIDEWQMLTDKSQYYPDETSLVTLAHKYRDKWQLIWLPDDLHFVGCKVREGVENAVAVHIGNTELSRWLKTAMEVKGNAD